MAEGVVFPLDSKSGKRSSVQGGKRILAASVRDVPGAAAAIEDEKDWRYGYAKHFVASVRAGLRSPAAAEASARAGLDEIYASFEFTRDGSTTLLRDAMSSPSPGLRFRTGLIRGTGAAGALTAGGFERVRMPYQGVELVGPDVVERAQRWADFGTVGPDVVSALQRLLDRPSVLDLSQHYFVLLGASSEMGPFEELLRLGANVVAVDLPGRPQVWTRLFEIARNSPGTLTFPLREDVAEGNEAEMVGAAGCNLLTETPEIAAWLESVHPDKSFTIGSYTYLDSDLFVRIAVAGDAIAAHLLARRPGTALAFLYSAADVFVVPEDAFHMAQRRIGKWWYSAVNKVSLGRLLQPNHHEQVLSDDGKEKFYICDGLAPVQGPNYALAKRLQQWRAVLCRRDGFKVSANIAPATFTASVEHNQVTYAISRAVSNFEPVEVFDKNTTQAIMGLLLVHDILCEESAAHPSFPLRNPLELMSQTAVDCGVWRAGVKVGSSGEVAVMIYAVGLPLQRLGLPSPLVSRL